MGHSTSSGRTTVGWAPDASQMRTVDAEIRKNYSETGRDRWHLSVPGIGWATVTRERYNDLVRGAQERFTVVASQEGATRPDTRTERFNSLEEAQEAGRRRIRQMIS